MPKTSVIINCLPSIVWKYFTDCKTWEEWYGGSLKEVDPGWVSGAKLIWKLGGSSTLESVVEGREVIITGSYMKTWYRFIPQGDETTCVEVEFSPRGGASFSDGGQAHLTSMKTALLKLKKCVEEGGTRTLTTEKIIEVDTEAKESTGSMAASSNGGLQPAVAPGSNGLSGGVAQSVRDNEQSKKFDEPLASVMQLIAAIRDEAVPMDFEFKSDARQEVAVKALIQIGASAVEPLIAAMNGGELEPHVVSPVTYTYYVKALGEIGDPRAVQPLITLRDDVDRRLGEPNIFADLVMPRYKYLRRAIDIALAACQESPQGKSDISDSKPVVAKVAVQPPVLSEPSQPVEKKEKATTTNKWGRFLTILGGLIFLCFAMIQLTSPTAGENVAGFIGALIIVPAPVITIGVFLLVNPKNKWAWFFITLSGLIFLLFTVIQLSSPTASENVTGFIGMLTLCPLPLLILGLALLVIKRRSGKAPDIAVTSPLAQDILTSREHQQAKAPLSTDQGISSLVELTRQPIPGVCYQCHKPLQDMAAGVYAGANMMAAMERIPYPCKSCGTHFCVNCMAQIKKEKNNICPYCGENNGW